MINSENIGQIVLGTVQQLMLIANVQNICNLIDRDDYNILRIVLSTL